MAPALESENEPFFSKSYKNSTRVADIIVSYSFPEPREIRKAKNEEILSG